MPQIFEFDSFRVDTEKRLLWRGGEQIQLEPKAFEMLIVLLENRGEIVCKDDLAKMVWKDVVATDDSIAQQISRLRKTLGDNPKAHRYIVTVPGVGYKFAAEVREVSLNGNGSVNYQMPMVDDTPSEKTLSEQPKKSDELKEVPKKSAPIERKTDWKLLAFVLLAFSIVAASAGFLWQKYKTEKASVLGVKKIAVLPFRAATPDDETNALKQGMTDTLVSRLSRLKEITVLPSVSTAGYEKSGQNPIEFGEKISADAVLDGQIQKNGETIRATVQLIHINDGKVLWSEEFLSQFTDIFEIQSVIAVKVAESLSLELSDEENRAIMKRHTSSAEAYRLYLDAFYLWARRASGEGRVMAERNYRRAIELDPKFALAYVGLANMLTDEPSRESYAQMKHLAEQALQIDSNLGEAYEALGFAQWRGDWNWKDSEENFKKAVKFSPNSIGAYCTLSMHLSGQGKFDEAHAVLASHPSPHIFLRIYVIATNYFKRDYDRTIAESREMLEKVPNDINTLSYLTLAYSEKGLHKEAIEAAEKYAAFDKMADVGALVYLGYAYAKAGEKEKAREILQKIIAKNAPPSAQIHGGLAAIYGALGEKDKAFEHLEKSIENREWWAFTLKVAPYYDSLRGDSRLDEMLVRINLK